MRRVFHADYVGDLGPMDYERARLATAGAELAAARCATGEELIARAAGAQVVWLEWTPHIDRAVLAALTECELVMRWGVGYDQIDVAAATELGVAVANAPSYGTENVAEHTMALLLALARGVVADDRAMRAGLWREPPIAHQRLSGHTLGILGLGRIGRRVAELGVAFGCRVIGHDVREEIALPDGVERASAAEVVAAADYLTVHTPLGEQTRHLVNRDLLAKARPGLLLVNTSRGPIVDTDALLAAIDAGIVAGAALDVFETEPLPADSPLRSRPEIVLTPHEASSSAEAEDDLRAEMCQATIQWFTEGWADSVVNPQVRTRLRRGR
ncbi:MAG TPA: C-terminal binding protein [Actinomycetota bacterium]|nr:C-terminal binding protein [Actinomycetota bacterium]